MHKIRSNVKYGGRTFKTMWEGTKTLKVFKADPRKCKGVKLIKKTIALGAGDDLTIVVNKRFPRVAMFDNTGLGTIPPDGTPFSYAPFVWRHAADLAAVAFRYVFANPEFPAGPSIVPVWVEGNQLTSPTTPGTQYRLRATRPDKDWTIAKSPFIGLEASRRYEWYLLGTTVKNAKFIVWSRAVSQPLP